MGIAVLGPLAVDGSGHLSRRDRVVLQTLVARAGQPVSADQLADALWGDQPPASAVKILQGCVVRLRKVLGHAAIETSPHGYRLTVPPEDVDAQRFERQLGRARELLALGEPDRAAFQVERALELWQGTPFIDLPDWPPAVTEGARLSELRLEAEELRIDANLRAGRHRAVLAEAQALVRAAPMRERRWTLLAEAQYRSGQQADALRTLHRLRSMLAGQLGIEPAPEVVHLEQAILRQDPSLVARNGLTAAHTECPYLGLMAFDISDADRFFGRDDDVAACLGILRRQSVLALVGPSGSGKSSILRAGVGSALHREGRDTVLITPGPHPVHALEALAGAPPTATLLVDQFEELFTLGTDSSEQRTFMELLTAHAQRRGIAVALRADHLADLVAHPEFSRLAERGLYLVGGLTDHGIRAAVEGPARQAGLVLEHGLVELLVREVHGEVGTLPLLSHALLETWKRREGSTLTVAGYQAAGGIHGAVAQSAERLYQQVPVEHRPLLRDVMLRLITPGPKGEPVRSRIPRRALVTDAHRDRLVEMLVAARLVTADDAVLEITHEALATAWPRLRGWLDDDVEGQRTLHHLSDAAAAWDSLDRPASELYRGVRLTRALLWHAQSERHLTELETAFLDASTRASEADEADLRERSRVQARLIKRLRVVLAGAVCLLVLALAAGGVAAVQNGRANRNAAEARTQGEEAQRQAVGAVARQVSARALTETDLSRSLLLAAASLHVQDSPEALSTLTAVVARNPALVRSVLLGPGQVQAVEMSSDGQRVATISATHEVQLVDLLTGEVRRVQVGPAMNESIQQRGLAFSPDGEVLAVGRAALSPRPVVLLDGRTLERLPAQPAWRAPGRWQVADLSFSQDGRSLAAGVWRIVGDAPALETAESAVAVWRLPAREAPRLLAARPAAEVTWFAGYLSIALSPRGDSVYVVPDRRVYDVASGTSRPFTDEPVAHDVAALGLSPDGTMIAFGSSASLDGPSADTVVVLDTRGGRVVQRIDGAQEVADLRFSADGRTVLTTDWPAGAPHPQVWDVESGRLVGSLTLTTGLPAAVALGPDGRSLVNVGTDHVLRAWDLTGQGTYLRRVPIRGFMSGSCFGTPSAGARFVAFVPCGFEDHSVKDAYVFLDVERRRTHLVRDAAPGWSLGGGSWRPGTHEFIRASGGTIRAFDGRTGRVLGSHHPLGNRVVDVDHSPDGSAVVAAEADGDVTMLDPDTFEPVGVPVHLGAPACCVSAGPDATALVTYGGLGPMRFWYEHSDRWAVVDLRSGSVLHSGPLSLESTNWAILSPDGARAVVTDFYGAVEVIDVARGVDVRPPLRAHTDGAFWAAFSPDGSRFVTDSIDGTAVLWDAASATPLARVAVDATYHSAEFRPDGTLLLAPWGGHAVFVWDPSSTRAVDFACRMAGRDLTADEWRDNFGTLPYAATCPEQPVP